MNEYTYIRRGRCTLAFPQATASVVKTQLSQLLSELALEQEEKGGEQHREEACKMSVPRVDQEAS